MRPPIFSSQLGFCLLRQPNFKARKLVTGIRFLSTHHDETFLLSIGNSGTVSLSVTRPTAAKDADLSRSKVILYLPPGPLFKGLDSDDDVIQNKLNSHSWPDSSTSLESKKLSNSACPSPQHALASMTSATVVTLNYRLGPSKTETASSAATETTSASPEPVKFHQYPTPVHDTLAGFDWIQSKFQPEKLGVFGSHIGGSLALMLALTEAKSVHAAAAVQPICDWPGLDEYCNLDDETDIFGKSRSRQRKSARRKGSAPPDLVPLLQAREQYFSSFERCFDAFASPILFLRSPGRDVPKSFPTYLTGPEYPVPVLRSPRILTAAERQAASQGSLWDRDVYPGSEADEDMDLDPVGPVRRRKALSRWPPYGLDYRSSGQTWSGPDQGIGRLKMTLPWVRVFVQDSKGESSDDGLSGKSQANKDAPARDTVLAQQGEEMVSVMRRACFWGREKGFGERRVSLASVDESLGKQVGSYFEHVFKDPELNED
ncbi:uncharacterized protein N7483_009555 [Penicillium malachiteum]|uniref:uncharacterized protein n=1 Tax=Penicillium malachiteum TaxID=1324776 RepID=UPI002548521E|nr:uncharacterized protein N7483_009555 [Penicillium malachiteum]KAJ5721621.1 hypothetical protein N7483_009555 [Penicillium malachiteum]